MPRVGISPPTAPVERSSRLVPPVGGTPGIVERFIGRGRRRRRSCAPFFRSDLFLRCRLTRRLRIAPLPREKNAPVLSVLHCNAPRHSSSLGTAKPNPVRSYGIGTLTSLAGAVAEAVYRYRLDCIIGHNYLLRIKSHLICRIFMFVSASAMSGECSDRDIFTCQVLPPMNPAITARIVAGT